jgi:hypothetical protein
MATFTITSGMESGLSLLNYRIVVTYSGGNATYQFLPPKGLGSGPLGTDTTPASGPPRFSSIFINHQLWDIYSPTPAPNPAPPGTTWSGTSYNLDSAEADPGTWTAEASGGVGFGEDEDEDGNEGEDEGEAEGPDEDDEQ